MWALDEKSSGVALVRRRPMRAVTLAGAVGGLLALVPLVVAPDPGPVRVLCFALLAVSSGALVFLGRSRPERVELVQKPGGLTWGEEPLPPPAYVALAGDANEEPPAYQALVGWADGRERLALQGAEPAGVLRGALELARRLGLDLRPAWGLEKHFAETEFARAWESASLEPAVGGALPKASVDLPLWPVQRNTAAITLIAGVFVLVVTAVLARSPARSVAPSALALALSGFTASLGLLLGAVFFGLRRRVELSTRGIQATLVLFGKAVGTKTLLGPSVARVFGVAPSRGPVRHVLFATSKGPISLPADAATAERLVVPTARSSAEERPQAELPLATSARYPRPDRPARLRS